MMSNVLALRILISPSSSITSTCEGSCVIDRAWARPTPQLLKPYPDPGAQAVAKFRRVRGRGEESLLPAMNRADKQRCFAWTHLYDQVLVLMKKINGPHERIRIMETVIQISLLKQNEYSVMKNIPILTYI